MKLLIVGAVDGELEKLNEIIATEKPEAVICTGDMRICSESTRLSNFMKNKFKDGSRKFLEFNSNGFNFLRPVYSLYGSLDDMFIRRKDLKIGNLDLKWKSIQNFVSKDTDESISTMSIGFLSGYYNNVNFDIDNIPRMLRFREKSSLALCMRDFNIFRNLDKLDVLISHESPLNCPPTDINPNNYILGCQHISSILRKSNVSLNVNGHHRKFYISKSNNTTIVGLPSLVDENPNYVILDTSLRTFMVTDGQTGTSYTMEYEEESASEIQEID